MNDSWTQNISTTLEIGSQRGMSYNSKFQNFSDVVNAHLDAGWRILNTYIENRGSQERCEECVILLAWCGEGNARVPNLADGITE